LIWGIVGIIVLIALICVYYINRIIVLGNRIRNAWAQIDVQLKKRTDLVPNLVETVKGYAKHEKEIMGDVTKAHAAMMKAETPAQKIRAATGLTAALKSIFALAENYPNLKANENFRLLQEQLEGIENKIAYSRQFYNDSVLEYNNLVTTIPGAWFAGSMHRTTMEFLEIQAAERKPVKVKF